MPAMMTISLALASHRLVEKHVLVTRLSATEDAARMTVLCSDKTGTITANRLAVTTTLPEPNVCIESQLLLWAALACKEENQDPIDTAILEGCKARQIVVDLQNIYRVLEFVPFDSSTRCTQALLETRATGNRFRVKKGSVMTLMEQCEISAEGRERWIAAMEELSRRGDRSLAVMIYFHDDNTDCGATELTRASTATEETSSSSSLNHKGQFAGLLALSDPPRADSKQVIESLRGIGVRVIMVTGDSIAIAKSVGAQVSLDPEEIVSIDEWRNRDRTVSNSMNTEHMATASPLLGSVHGFAEVFPEDKHTIVTALQKRHFIVGMTGDGVNDAPALKQAEVGVAVSNATDVAKRSASAIMMKDGLSGILDMIVEGRQIHGTSRRHCYDAMFSYLLYHSACRSAGDLVNDIYHQNSMKMCCLFSLVT